MTLQKIIPLVLLIFTVLCALPLAGAAVVPSATAQEEDNENLASRIVSGTLEDGSSDAVEDQPNTQTIGQPTDQGNDQVLDQSEENDQHDNNTHSQIGASDQDSAQGIVDGDDLSETSSQSGDAKKKYYGSSSSTSGDALNDNEQGGVNDADLNLDQDVTIDENHASVFGDDTAELDNTNVAEPLGVPVNIQEEESVLVEEKTLAPTQTPTPPTDDDNQPTEEPPEEDEEVFCFESEVLDPSVVLCFENLEDCEVGEDAFGFVISECEEFEAVPADAQTCTILEAGGIFCTVED
jgi:hypothetical protein